MSHCIQYSDPMDCDKPTCRGCRMEKSNIDTPIEGTKCETCLGADTCLISDCITRPAKDEDCEYYFENREMEVSLEYPDKDILLPEGCIAEQGTTGCHFCMATGVYCDLIVDDNRPCKAYRYQAPELKALTVQEIYQEGFDDVCDYCKSQGKRCILEEGFNPEPGYCMAGRC